MEKSYSGSISQTVKPSCACPGNLSLLKTQNELCAKHTAALFVRLVPGQKNELDDVYRTHSENVV